MVWGRATCSNPPHGMRLAEDDERETPLYCRWTIATVIQGKAQGKHLLPQGDPSACCPGPSRLQCYLKQVKPGYSRAGDRSSIPKGRMQPTRRHSRVRRDKGKCAGELLPSVGTLHLSVLPLASPEKMEGGIMGCGTSRNWTIHPRSGGLAALTLDATVSSILGFGGKYRRLSGLIRDDVGSRPMPVCYFTQRPPRRPAGDPGGKETQN